jgi:hypothetical protein
MGCGCLVRLALAGLLLVLMMLISGCFLVTRPVGPAFENGAFVYDLNGTRHEVRLSTAAARRYDDKLSGKLSLGDIRDAATGGIAITEEELNSRAAEELAARGLANGQQNVDRVFIRLTSSGAKAYVYTSASPLAVTLAADLQFVVHGGRVTVEFSDVHAGKLPIGPVVDAVLDRGDNRRQVEEALTLVIPPQVKAIHVEEGRLRAVLSIVPAAR